MSERETLVLVRGISEIILGWCQMITSHSYSNLLTLNIDFLNFKGDISLSRIFKIRIEGVCGMFIITCHCHPRQSFVLKVLDEISYLIYKRSRIGYRLIDVGSTIKNDISCTHVTCDN